MNINYKVFQRPAAALSALALIVGVVAPVLGTGLASAAQVQDRSITMSDATPGATVQYKLTFTPAANAQELIVDFCGDTPLIEASCDFSAASVPTIGAGITSNVGTAVQKGSGTPVHTIRVTGLTMTAGIPFTIIFTAGITNPTAVDSFYARVITYTTGNSVNYTQADTTGGATSFGTGSVDFGGIALSTVQSIEITAKVMETLTFCVSGTNVANCSLATDPAVNLGTQVGSGTNYVLENANQVYAAGTYTLLSTNALNGADVRVKTTSSATCSGLSSNAGTDCNSIPAIGGAAALLNGSAGNAGAAFGMCVDPGVATTAQAPYNDATCAASNDTTLWAMDENNTTGATSTYGDDLYTIATAVKDEVNRVNYGVRSTNVTPAGIYKTTQSLIATAKF